MAYLLITLLLRRAQQKAAFDGSPRRLLTELAEVRCCRLIDMTGRKGSFADRRNRRQTQDSGRGPRRYPRTSLTRWYIRNRPAICFLLRTLLLFPLSLRKLPLAAQLSSRFNEAATYFVVLEFPAAALPSEDASQNDDIGQMLANRAATFINNCLAQFQPDKIILLGLPPAAQSCLRAILPPQKLICVNFVASAGRSAGNSPRWWPAHSPVAHPSDPAETSTG